MGGDISKFEQSDLEFVWFDVLFNNVNQNALSQYLEDVNV